MRLLRCMATCMLLAGCPTAWSAEPTPSGGDTPQLNSPPPIVEVELPAEFSQTTQPAAPPAAGSKPDPKPAKPEPEPSGAQLLPFEIEVGTGYSLLNNGYVDWSAFYLNAEMKLAERNNVYGSVRQENRYSKNDTEMVGGFYQPVDENFTLEVEATMSPEHNFLPMRSLLTQVDYGGLKGWTGGVGIRHVDYTHSELNVLTATIERYLGNYRFAYTHFQGFLLGRGSTNSNRIQIAKYYGDRNWYGLSASTGTEMETLPTSQLTSRVYALVLNGMYWVQSRRAITYAIGNYHQGDFYIRNGAQLGLRYEF